MAHQSYEQELARLMGMGWKPGDPIPESLIKASNTDQPGSVTPGAAPEGSPGNPMALDTMMVQGTPPPAGPAQAGAGAPPPRPGVFEGMSDADADQYAGMGDLKRQMGLAEEMRGTADAEGQTVNRGRTFVAANPLEHAVVGAKRWKGARDAKRLGKEQTKGRRSFVDLLRNRDKDDFSDTEVDYQFMESEDRYA